ncbi:Protein-lysine methyltransferase METTL21D, partial [Glycine soja]
RYQREEAKIQASVNLQNAKAESRPRKLEGMPGVIGAVMWDNGVALGKFPEHVVDSGMFVLQGKKIVELGSGCELVGCIAALLGSEVIVTYLPDRLRLLRKNIEINMEHVSLRGSVTATELTWGDDLDPKLIDPTPDFVIRSNVVYTEGEVVNLLETLMQLSRPNTTIFLARELRNGKEYHSFLFSCGSPIYSILSSV